MKSLACVGSKYGDDWKDWTDGLFILRKFQVTHFGSLGPLQADDSLSRFFLWQAASDSLEKQLRLESALIMHNETCPYASKCKSRQYSSGVCSAYRLKSCMTALSPSHSISYERWTSWVCYAFDILVSCSQLTTWSFRGIAPEPSQLDLSTLCGGS